MLRILLFLLIPFFTFGQQENWDVYMASYEKGPGSTVVNLGLKSSAPVKAFAFVVITGVKFIGCTNDGLPANEQFTDLYKIADSVDSIITRSVKAIHAGTFTYQCQRLHYYYVGDTNNLRLNLQKLYSTGFSKYESYINIEDDKAWEAYLSFLYPNEETQEYMSNQKIALKLQESGDNLEKARKVDHWFYFKAESDLKCIMTYLKENHFQIEGQDKTGPSAMPFRLQVSRKDKVDPDSMTIITLELRKRAAACKGNYDGWETLVVK